MPELMELRDYQKECVDIINGLDPGSYLVVMATGLGKTVTFSRINRRGRVLILSHREELVYQPKKYYDCSYGVEIQKETSHGEEIVSASVFTLIRRLDRFKPEDFDIIITDEAHHAVAPSYQKVYAYFRPRLHLGFTATPNRADNVKLGNVYSKIIFERNIKWGIDNGYLTDIRCMRADVGYNLKGVRTSMGDFSQSDLTRALNIESCNHAVAEVYHTKAIGKTLIFCATKPHAHSLAKLIPGSEVVDEGTKNRSEILDRFANGSLDVLINCMVLTEGTDLPMVRTIIICRPTQNISLYTQAVGRGLRLYKDKKELLLIDCTGVSSLPICTAPVLFGLDPDTKTDGELLTDVEEKVEKKKQEKMAGEAAPWKINTVLVDIFEEKGGYDTHGVCYTILETGDMVCPLGGGVSLMVEREDIIGNSSLVVKEWDKVLLHEEDLPMQEALDRAYEVLKNSYSTNITLWERSHIERWGSYMASDKQKNFIRKLYDGEALEKIDFASLKKYEASVLISQGIDRLERKKHKSPELVCVGGIGLQAATDKQISFIRDLYQSEELKDINLETLDRRGASELITKGLEKREKEGEKGGSILQKDQ